MTSVARGRGTRRAGPVVPHLPPLPGVSPPLPLALEQQRQRALTAVLDVARIGLTVRVLRVAQSLTLPPSACTLAALEGELRDTLLALGATRLTELVRLRGTGDLGPASTCPGGVRLVRKEVAPLCQRTWFGVITLERTVEAGQACRVRVHHVPLDAAWGLLGATEPAAADRLPDADGGTLAPVAPGTGPARLAPGLAAVVVACGARLPYGEAASLWELVFGVVARLAPNTVRADTRAAGRAREPQEAAAVAQAIRPRPPTRAQVRAVLDAPVGPPPAAAPEVLVIRLDGALERTRQGWKAVKLGAIAALVARGTATAAAVLGAVTSTATLAPAQAFGAQRLTAAQRRGLGWAPQVVILGDGAKWIWKLAARRFGGAIEIVDWSHAHQHLWTLAHLLSGEGAAATWTWLETLAGARWVAESSDDVAVIAQATDEAWATPRQDLPDGTPRRTQARHREVGKAVASCTTNASRMRDGAFRTQGLPVGSGVVEGGCQHVLHVRLKRPGAHWEVDSAEQMVRARAVAGACSAPAPRCSHPHDQLACSLPEVLPAPIASSLLSTDGRCRNWRKPQGRDCGRKRPAARFHATISAPLRQLVGCM
ncbi:MAG: hypothetical protein HYY04_14840 [Chloroflexi bacterium]|nr:hypothetical protein [Chloroflexota bacterium]